MANRFGAWKRFRNLRENRYISNAVRPPGRAAIRGHFVESENGARRSAQNALLRMRLFCSNAREVNRLRRFDQPFVQIAPEREILGPFSRFSQRYPQGFPQILCKEGVAFPNKTG